MEEILDRLKEKVKIIIKGKEYIVKTKTWYSIVEDESASYIKCELSEDKVLVVIPDDDLIYIGSIIENMNYERISDDIIKYNGIKYTKSGNGSQYIKSVEFGNIDEVEGKCIFEDYEAENNIISLGILPDENNKRADVFADIIELNDIIF